jgi:hypothetical protein
MMPQNDARKLDHKTLEEIRTRAVERVQAGESPEVVIAALGFSRSCIYSWLAMYPNWWLVSIEGQGADRTSEEHHWPPDAMDLFDGGGHESFAAPIRVRFVDTGDNPDADQEAIWSAVEREQCGTITQPTGLELPKAPVPAPTSRTRPW